MDTNDGHDYFAVEVLQQPGAPKMYLLSVAADELLEWADVPSAQHDYMAGYQRIYSQERAKQITDFLELDPANIIPGAIIVTVNEDAIVVSEVQPGVSRLQISVKDKDFDTVLSEVYQNFKGRLSEEEIASLQISEDGSIAAVLDEDTGGVPDSYLATLSEELGRAVADFNELEESRQMAIKNYISSVSKPGLIIDGQHRVFGAKDVSKNSVRLPIVLLPGLSFAEQVFHFYVLNNKAKPLSPTELRRTISTSLTNKEIAGLWNRFDDAGVNPEATRWTHKMNTSPASPFFGLIDFGLGGSGFLKENVAYQLVSRFMNMSRKYRQLHINIPAFSIAKDDSRLDYFYDIWGAIRDRYQEAWDLGVATEGSQLFYKASLLVLQDFVLDRLIGATELRAIDGRPSPMEESTDLRRTVNGVLSNLPEEFFTTEWQVKQMDTAPGREFFRGQIDKAVNNQGLYMMNQTLFKKQAQ